MTTVTGFTYLMSQFRLDLITITSPYKIRRYGVSIKNIETIAVPSIKPKPNAIIILDEIGKMECFSEAFKKAATEALDAPYIVVGTITLGGDDFIRGIKIRGDIELMEVTIENRNQLSDIILERISLLYRTTKT